MSDVLERIERGEIRILLVDISKPRKSPQISNDERDAEAELLRLAKLGAGRQWIPVSERLPEINTPVLIKLGNGEMQVVKMGWSIYPKENRKEPYWYGYGVFKASGIGDNYGPSLAVIHWMPLPEPPETGQTHE